MEHIKQYIKQNGLLVILVILAVVVIGLVAVALGYSFWSGLLALFGAATGKNAVKIEDAASDKKDAALLDAAQKQQSISKQARVEVQTIRDKELRHNAQIRDDQDADRQIQDAIKRSKQGHDNIKKNGILGLLLLLLPMLMGCMTAHGSASGTGGPEWVKIRKETWQEAIKALNQCNADRQVLVIRINENAQKAKVRCDTRVRVCRADLTSCREQKAAIRCPSCTWWKVLVGILGATAAAGVGWALYERFKPQGATSHALYTR